MFSVDNPTTFIAAFRYALGRSTYIVSDVIEDIEKNINDIDSGYLRTIKEEIEEAIKNNNVGMDIDKKQWENLLCKINQKLKERNHFY